MRHLWTVVCRHASVEKDTNIVSLLDVFEELTVQFNEPEIPPTDGQHLLPIPLEVVTLWHRDSGPSDAAKFKTFLKTPIDPQPAGFAEGIIERGAAPRVRVISRAAGLPWRGPGDYTFVVQLLTKKRTWKTVAEVPFWLKLGTPPTVVTAQAAAPAKAPKLARRSRAKSR